MPGISPSTSCVATCLAVYKPSACLVTPDVWRQCKPCQGCSLFIALCALIGNRLLLQGRKQLLEGPQLQAEHDDQVSASNGKRFRLYSRASKAAQVCSCSPYQQHIPSWPKYRCGKECCACSIISCYLPSRCRSSNDTDCFFTHEHLCAGSRWPQLCNHLSHTLCHAALMLIANVYQVQLEQLQDRHTAGSGEAFWRMFPTLLYSPSEGPRLGTDAHTAIQAKAVASTCDVAGQPAVTLDTLPLQLSREDMLTLVNNQPNARVMNFYMGLLQVLPWP